MLPHLRSARRRPPRNVREKAKPVIPERILALPSLRNLHRLDAAKRRPGKCGKGVETRGRLTFGSLEKVPTLKRRKVKIMAPLFAIARSRAPIDASGSFAQQFIHRQTVYLEGRFLNGFFSPASRSGAFELGVSANGDYGW